MQSVFQASFQAFYVWPIFVDSLEKHVYVNVLVQNHSFSYSERSLNETQNHIDIRESVLGIQHAISEFVEGS